MRCTRCHLPAVPQAVGVTPAGVFVFGWCVACLEETGCHQVVVARPPRRPSTRLVLERSTPRFEELRRPRHPLDDRRRLAGAVALILSLWGLLLFGIGLTLWTLGLPDPKGPTSAATGLRIGGPSLLIGGGGTTAAVGLIFWALNSSLMPLRSKRALRVIQGVSFLTAIGTLLAGIVYRSPRRDPLIVGVASTALVVSAAARWIEIRRTRALASWGQELP